MISDRLRMLRKSHHLSQDDVAERLGISRSGYSAYELGTHQPDPTMLMKLAQCFGTTADYLVGLTEDPAPVPQLEPRLREIVEIYNNVGSESRRFIYQLTIQEQIHYQLKKNQD